MFILQVVISSGANETDRSKTTKHRITTFYVCTYVLAINPPYPAIQLKESWDSPRRDLTGSVAAHRVSHVQRVPLSAHLVPKVLLHGVDLDGNVGRALMNNETMM